MQSTHTSYTPPVDQLLTYGEGKNSDPKQWPNYLELGFELEHVPELIRMMTDEELNNADSESLEVWAPLHAWRTLGQLRAESAIDALISFREETSEENEWAREEIPEVLGMIGPAAFPALTARLTNPGYDDELRINIITSIEKVGIHWPDARATSIEILSNQLELFAENDPEVNAFIVSSLIELHATETAPLIKQAFASGNVDTMILGDWDDVQVELGLLSTDELHQRRSRHLSEISFPSPIRNVQTPTKGGPTHASGQKKAKQKMAKQSRKKNRKR